MVHTFTSLGVHIAVDVNSGAVHVLDKPAYDLLSLLETPLGDMCPDHVAAQLPYERSVIEEAWLELLELQKDGLLFTEDDYIDPSAAAAMQRMHRSKRYVCTYPMTVICGVNTVLLLRVILAPDVV